MVMDGNRSGVHMGSWPPPSQQDHAAVLLLSYCGKLVPESTAMLGDLVSQRATAVSGPPEAVQPAVHSTENLPVGLGGVAVIEGVHDLAGELLVAADANDDLAIGLHAPEQSPCHLSLQMSGQLVAFQVPADFQMGQEPSGTLWCICARHAKLQESKVMIARDGQTGGQRAAARANLVFGSIWQQPKTGALVSMLDKHSIQYTHVLHITGVHETGMFRSSQGQVMET